MTENTPRGPAVRPLPQRHGPRSAANPPKRRTADSAPQDGQTAKLIHGKLPAHVRSIGPLGQADFGNQLGERGVGKRLAEIH